MEEAEKIKIVLKDILVNKNLQLVSLKSVRDEVAEKMNVDVSYFIDNKEKKKLLKNTLEDMLCKLFIEQKNATEQVIDASVSLKNSEKKEKERKHESESTDGKSDEDDSHNSNVTDENGENSQLSESQIEKSVNKKNQRKKRKLKELNDEASENNEKEVKRRGKSDKLTKAMNTKKNKLKKIVSDLKIGPNTYKNLKSENDEEFCSILEKRIIEFCQKKNICSEPNRLPNANEIHEYQKMKKLNEELDGIDPSNIIESSRTRGRSSMNYSVYQTTSKLDDEDAEENHEKEKDSDGGEEENEEEEEDDEEEEFDENDFEDEDD